MKPQNLKPPSHLSPDSQKVWKRIVGDYDIDTAASLVLVATLEARDRKEQARATLEKEGTTQTDRFGFLKPHPSVALERDAAATMMRGFRLLGFDQEARGESARRD
jgi:P27 family predicted phage terminase small subunit